METKTETPWVKLELDTGSQQHQNLWELNDVDDDWMMIFLYVCSRKEQPLSNVRDA